MGCLFSMSRVAQTDRLLIYCARVRSFESHSILGECSLSVHLAANGHIMAKRHWGDISNEERNWPPYVICRWLRTSVLSNKRSPAYKAYGSLVFTFFALVNFYLDEGELITEPLLIYKLGGNCPPSSFACPQLE